MVRSSANQQEKDVRTEHAAWMCGITITDQKVYEPLVAVRVIFLKRTRTHEIRIFVCQAARDQEDDAGRTLGREEFE